MECVMFQLCAGGSVTELVQGLKQRNDRLTEEQIAYIVKETTKVCAQYYWQIEYIKNSDKKDLVT